MTEKLKEELARIGETVEPVYVAPDTWARGRRARRRDQLLAGAAVFALIACLGGLVGLIRSGTPSLAPAVPGETGHGALPSHIWNVPERLTERGNDDEWTGPVETDLAIGQVSVAFVTRSGLPVLIGAADGRYHLMALDGWLDQSSLTHMSAKGQAALSLSPDGTQLAYGWAGPVPESDMEPVPTGVRLVDLTTGTARVVPVQGGQSVAIEEILWSPDSRWLVWAGRAAKYWTSSSTNFKWPAAGRIAPGATASETVPVPRPATRSLSISDDGRIAWFAAGRLSIWDNDGALSWRKVDSFNSLTGIRGPAAWSPDGRWIAFSSNAHSGGASLVDPDKATNDMGLTVPPVPAHTNVRTVQPLGWIDATHFLMGVEQDDPDGRHISLAIRSAPLPRGNDAVVTTTDLSSLTSLTVAADLITDFDQPTHDFPEPDWPWTTGHKLWVGALVVVGTGLAAYLLLTALGLGFVVRRVLWFLEIVLAVIVFSFALMFVAGMAIQAVRADSWFGRLLPIAMALLPALAVRNIGLGLRDRWKAWRLSRADTPSESGSASPR